MKKLLLTAIVGALASTTALADDWVIGGYNTETAYLQLVNVDSIDCEGKVCTSWAAGVSANPKDPYDLTQQFVEVDCKKMMWKFLHESQYLKGKQIRSFPAEVSFDVIVPGTIGYAAAEVVCKKVTNSVFFSARSPFDLVKPGKEFIKKEKKAKK